MADLSGQIVEYFREQRVVLPETILSSSHGSISTERGWILEVQRVENVVEVFNPLEGMLSSGDHLTKVRLHIIHHQGKSNIVNGKGGEYWSDLLRGFIGFFGLQSLARDQLEWGYPAEWYGTPDVVLKTLL